MRSTLQKHMHTTQINSPKLLRGPEKSPHTGMDIARLTNLKRGENTNEIGKICWKGTND